VFVSTPLPQKNGFFEKVPTEEQERLGATQICKNVLKSGTVHAQSLSGEQLWSHLEWKATVETHARRSQDRICSRLGKSLGSVFFPVLFLIFDSNQGEIWT